MKSYFRPQKLLQQDQNVSKSPIRLRRLPDKFIASIKIEVSPSSLLLPRVAEPMTEESQIPDREQIVRDLQNEGTEALAKYFSMVQERLRRVVNFRLDYRLSGRVSESDVIQETFVRAAQRIDSFVQKDDMPFFVWLRLEVSQKLHEVHRHHFGAEKRDIRKEIKLAENAADSGRTSMQLAAHIVAQLTSPSRLIERAEQIVMLEKTLNEMNELDREIIALRNFEELSNVETAKILDIEPAAASKRYLRALKRLRQIMQSAKKNG